MSKEKTPLRVYEYAKCSTCKKALEFLKKNKLSYEVIPIAEKPPTTAELKRMLASVGSLRRLFNTSGMLYRELKLSEKLPKLSESEALSLLSKNGMLVKRPFLLSSQTCLVGFKEKEWKDLLKRT